MAIILFSLSCILPLVVYLLIGFVTRTALKLSQSSFLDLNTLAFYTLLPVHLFISIYRSDLRGIRFSDTALAAFIGVAVIFFIGLFAFERSSYPREDKSVLIVSMFRTNFILLGVPLTERILGVPSSGLTGVLTAILIPAFNILSVIVLSIYSGKKQSWGRVLWTIMKNPMIISAALAIGLNLLQIRLPGQMLEILQQIAALAMPFSLIALGGRFQIISDATTRKALVQGLLLRLLIIPLIALSIYVALGFRGEALAILLVLFAGPVAVTAYTMAQQMGGNERLASQMLVFSTIFSGATLFVFISVFKYFQWL